ncbi:MAG: DUF5115 domain-containing protein [Prevotella copri]|nr:DUF5115 domain-containing protein [Segatella copri]
MTKKILFAFVIAAGLASCSEDYTDWNNPQHNDAEEAVAAAYGVQFVGSGVDVNMGDENNPEKIKLVSMATSNPDVDSLRFMSIKINNQVIPYTVEGNDAYVSTYSLDSCAMVALKTRKYEKRELNVDVEATVYPKSKTAVAIKGGLKQNETPIPTPEIDPKGYYILGDIENVGWTPSKGLMMTDKGNGIYTATVTTTNEENWFKFYGATGFSTDDNNWDLVNKYQYGCQVNGDAATFNMLEWKDVKTPTIAGAGTWIVTLDMINCTYTISKPILYMAGDANGWAQIDYLASVDGSSFTGFMYLNQNGFKFCSEPNWDGTNYGATFFSKEGDNIIMTEEAGYYKVDVDLSAKTYTLTPITTIGVIGDATEGGWDSDQDMTYVPYNSETKEPGYWEITDINLTAGAIKFRANDAWDISWGGDINSLTTNNGGNITVEAGTYDIKLYAWADGYAKCELTKK